MATRHAISINDDGGSYSITLGARRVEWAEVKHDLEQDYADESDATFEAEPLVGWAPWTWAIHALNPAAANDDVAVCFVDGDDEPDMPYGGASSARADR
jgi:hypothetical protein